ncbi:Hypothetical predicted protein, partial [Pelobates cultripes]
MPKTHLAITYHTLTSANLLIAQHWKFKKPPDLTYLLNQITLNWTYEAMHQHQFGPKQVLAKAKTLWDTFTQDR